MTDTILTDMQLSDVTCSCVINAPIERVDLATWLFKLSEGEYRRCCPPDHISCGTTFTDAGKPMVITHLRSNVMWSRLLRQHYVSWSLSQRHLRRTVALTCR